MGINIQECRERGHVRNYVDGKLEGPAGAPLFVGPPNSSFKKPLPERQFAGVKFKLIGTDAATNCAVYAEDKPKKKAAKPKKTK